MEVSETKFLFKEVIFRLHPSFWGGSHRVVLYSWSAMSKHPQMTGCKQHNPQAKILASNQNLPTWTTLHSQQASSRPKILFAFRGRLLRPRHGCRQELAKPLAMPPATAGSGTLPAARALDGTNWASWIWDQHRRYSFTAAITWPGLKASQYFRLAGTGSSRSLCNSSPFSAQTASSSSKTSIAVTTEAKGKGFWRWSGSGSRNANGRSLAK